MGLAAARGDLSQGRGVRARLRVRLEVNLGVVHEAAHRPFGADCIRFAANESAASVTWSGHVRASLPLHLGEDVRAVDEAALPPLGPDVRVIREGGERNVAGAAALGNARHGRRASRALRRALVGVPGVANHRAGLHATGNGRDVDAGGATRTRRQRRRKA